MKSLNQDELWNYCVGMTWVWDYCKTGTAKSNAAGVQEWVERNSRGENTASLKVCASVAAAIQRSQKDPWGKGVGNKIGQLRW